MRHTFEAAFGGGPKLTAPPCQPSFHRMNNSDTDAAKVKLSIDYKALGFRPELGPRMVDVLTGAMYGYQGQEHAVIFPLKARSFRLLATYDPYL